MNGIRIVIPALLLLFLIQGCNNTPQEQEAPTAVRDVSVATDSFIRKDILIQVDSLNASIRNNMVSPVTIGHTFKTEADSIDYWIVDGAPVRISLRMRQGESLQWPTYFIQDSQLIHVRYRELIKNDTAYRAFERMSYLQDGKIVFAEDRYVTLQPNEIPALLRAQPYHVSTVPFTELAADFMPYFEEMYKAVIEDSRNKQRISTN